jgi:Uma2 family endonuclease
MGMDYNYHMSAAKILLTAEEFDNYPFEEDKRYELDEGELIEMTRSPLLPGFSLTLEELFP